MTDHLAWQDQAACIDSPTGMFFPGSGGDTDQARQVCATCPVTIQCLTGAIDRAEDHGIWAGHGPTELRRLQRLARRHGSVHVATAATEAFHARTEHRRTAPIDDDNVAVVLRFSRPEQAIYERQEA